MLPDFLFTVRTPLATTQSAGAWAAFAVTHSFRSLPSNSTMASDGAALLSAPGVTTFGSGDQTSVSSGFGLGASCWANAGTIEATKTKADTTDSCVIRIVFGILESKGSEGQKEAQRRVKTVEESKGLGCRKIERPGTASTNLCRANRGDAWTQWDQPLELPLNCPPRPRHLSCGHEALS